MHFVSLRVAALTGAAMLAALVLPATAHATAVRTAAVPTAMEHTSVSHSASRVAPQASGSWEGSGTEPTLYTYGLWEGGSVIDPPANLPASAVITNVCFTFNYTYPHPGSGIWILVDNQVGYWENTTGNEVGCSTADNGQSASQEFQGYFGSPGGSNGYYPPINPPATPSGLYTVTVYYSS